MPHRTCPKCRTKSKTIEVQSPSTVEIKSKYNPCKGCKIDVTQKPIVNPQQHVVPNYPPLPGPRNYAGKNVVIVGGSRGVGKDLAEKFAGIGANVIATTHRNPSMYPAPPAPGTPGGYTLWYQPVDFRSDASVKQFFDLVGPTLGCRIHLLIVVAVNYPYGPLVLAEPHDIPDGFNGVYFGHPRIVLNAVKYMTRDDLILSFASAVSESFEPIQPIYSAAKRAIVWTAGIWNSERCVLQNKLLDSDPRKEKLVNTPKWVTISPGWFQRTVPTLNCGCNGYLDISFIADDYYLVSNMQLTDPVYAEVFAGLGPISDASSPSCFVANAVYNITTQADPEWRYLVLNLNGFNFGPNCVDTNPNGFYGDQQVNSAVNAAYSLPPNEFIAYNCAVWSGDLDNQTTTFTPNCSYTCINGCGSTPASADTKDDVKTKVDELAEKIKNIHVKVAPKS